MATLSSSAAAIEPMHEDGAMGTQQSVDKEYVEPGRFIRFLVKHPAYVMMLVVLVAVILSLAAFMPYTFRVTNGGGGFVVRNHPISKRYDSLVEGIDVTNFVVNATEDAIEERQSVPLLSINFIYVDRSDAADVTRQAFMERLREFEDGFEDRMDYADFCAFERNRTNGPRCSRPISLTNYVYPTILPSGQQRYDGRGATIVPDVDDQLADVAASDSATALDRLIGVEWNATANPVSPVTQSFWTFALPIAGYASSNDDREQQRSIVKDWIVDQRSYFLEQDEGDFDMVWFGDGITEYETNLVIISDSILITGSVTFVVLYMWFHTGSLFLSGMAVVDTLFSVPMSWFVIRVFFQVTIFNTLNNLAVFIVLGVAADDSFIFLDAWKQSEFAGPKVSSSLVTRMAWTYKRAAGAMLVTSLTTSTAFFTNAVSTVPPIRTFGLFSGSMILFNYFMVITWYPAVVIIWHRHMRNKYCCCCCTKKSKRVDDGSDVEVGMEVMGAGAGAGASKPHRDRAGVGMDDNDGVDEASLRPAELFFRTKWAPLLRSARWFVVGFAVIMLVYGVYFTTQLGPSSEPGRFLPDDHNVQRAIILGRTAFKQQEKPVTVHLVAGIRGIDRSGTDPNDGFDRGRVVWDEDWAPENPEVQQYLFDLCEAARNEASVLRRQVTCPMEEFASYLSDNNKTFPVPSEEFFGELQAFTTEYAEENFVSETGEEVSFISGAKTDFSTTIRWEDGGDTLRFIQIIVNTTVETDAPATRVEPIYNDWNTFLDNQEALMPSSLRGKMMQTSERWVTMRTEQELVYIAVLAIALSMVLAMVILLLGTGNVVTAGISFGVIVIVVLASLGTMAAAGWDLGVIESINITVLVGLCVDYIMHIAVAYEHTSPGLNRYTRARLALSTIGISVLSAGITTFVSAIILFAAIIIFFLRFGQFVAIVIGMSLVGAMVFLPAFLMLVGPERRFGSLAVPWNALVQRICPTKRFLLRPVWDDDMGQKVVPGESSAFPANDMQAPAGSKAW